MARRHRSVPFADVVRKVRATPPAPQPFDLLAPGGHGFRLVDEDITPERARDVAVAGATLGWDGCGCGGDCGWRWHTREQVARAAPTGPPIVVGQRRSRGRIALLRSDDGEHLLLAHHPVRWGTLLD